MGRPRLFNREDFLRKALPVFWSRGYADTAVQDLEKATGVNKSRLYAEFKDKQDIFVESLRYYFASIVRIDTLTKEPLGWANIKAFLKYLMLTSFAGQKGCFGVNSMRELNLLPPAAQDIITDNRTQLKRLLAANVSAEKPKKSPDSIADLLLTFSSGICIEQNLKASKATLTSKIENLVTVLRAM
jgi:AcrR family transcriptional regulator